MRFDEIARDLVHTASRLLRGRIVNIMDTSGVIVASTDAERIGTTHEGAREVVRTGRPVAIEKSDVPRYPGAREGYNLPVLSDNRLTAVVGVYGNPEEVRDSAYILQAYTEQFFRQKAIERQSRISDGLRADYIRILMNLSAGGGERLAELAGALDLKLEFPVRMLAFSVRGAEDSLTRQQLLSRVAEELQSQRLIDAERDVWAVIEDKLLVLKSGGDGNYLRRAHGCAEDAAAARRPALRGTSLRGSRRGAHLGLRGADARRARRVRRLRHNRPAVPFRLSHAARRGARGGFRRKDVP